MSFELESFAEICDLMVLGLNINILILYSVR
jgi:hypothetical protein